MFKLVLEKAEEPEIKLAISAGSWKKQDSTRETSISALLTMPKLPYWPSNSTTRHHLSSVKLSHSVMSDSLRPLKSQLARPPCPSPAPGVYSNSCPLSQCCHPSGDLILCHPLLLLPSIFPSIRVFSNKSVLCIRWPKYWSFSFSISPSNAYSRLISFRIDWLDLLAVQGTLKRLLQRHNSKASILWHSAFS